MFKRFKASEPPPFNNLIVGGYSSGGRDYVSFTRAQVLLLQFSKLLNFFPDQMEAEWGGGLGPLTESRYMQAKYLFETQVVMQQGPCWLHRKDGTKPWGPGNFVLKDVPNIEFGSPFEPYMAVNGSLVTINQAKRFLAVDSLWLIRVKLHLLLDELVILEAVKQLLSPPPLWAKQDVSIKGLVSKYQPTN